MPASLPAVASFVPCERAGEESRAEIVGVLDFDTVPAILHSGSRYLRAHRAGRVVIDLSQVSAANSAAMALFLQWRAEVAANGGELIFHALPESVQQLAHICGVFEFLCNEDAISS